MRDDCTPSPAAAADAADLRDRARLARRFGPLVTGAWITQAVAVAAELGIVDLLASGPRSAADLAAAAKVDGPSLHRLLRALASIGLLTQDEADRFRPTALGALLAEDAPGSQRALAMVAGREFYRAWAGLAAAVRDGTPAFEAEYGAPFFRYLERNPDRWGLYDAAMNTVHGAETEPVLDAYDLADARTVVDVGGGNGQALAATLRRHPHLAGILFDLPDVAARAGAVLAAPDLAGRGTAVGGDFFVAVPPGADVYLLRHVIHDWEDESAAGILRRCARAMAPGGRILVVETVIPPGDAPCFGKWLDLMMLVVGGRERTRPEYEAVFAAAGLRLARVVPTAHEVSVLEGLAVA